MNNHPLAQKFSRIKVGRSGGSHAVNKPLLLLLALSRCFSEKSRLAEFVIYEALASEISEILGQKINICYPFGRLASDEIWEIQSEAKLSVNDSGDLYRSELVLNQVKGGFISNVYGELLKDKPLILTISNQLIHNYFPATQHASLLTAVGLSKSSGEVRDMWMEYHDTTVSPPPPAPDYLPKESILTTQNNGYIAYLNSLHNLGAGGANALAETQALNPYFAALYEPFPVVEAVISALQDGGNRVVVLTGHAGDGKSTVALDVLKRLRGLSPTEPLSHALQERETAHSLYGPVTIVKDMSELSAHTRLQWLGEAFNQPGCWLVISNTGPLLNSLSEFSKPWMTTGDVENRLLGLMGASYIGGGLLSHTLTGLPKDLVILNLTRLDNVELGTRVLTKMLNHPAWADCANCPAVTACPLRLNREALQSLGTALEERVRWVYQRLTHYEQRLTLRQMVAHLALSLTGGMDCKEAQRQVEDSTAEGAERGVDGLAKILFSETFFGYRNGKEWEAAEGLRAVALARRLVAGAPVAVDYERQIVGREGVDWAEPPETLNALWQRWRKDATNFNGVARRFAVRRMLYVFGQPISTATAAMAANIFFDTFLRSPRLRDFDRWQREARLTLGTANQEKLRDACLRVLLECYSGFSAGQFDAQDRLYLTLRRADRAVAQPTQWVVAVLPFDDFELYFDPNSRLPLLRYRPCCAVALKLDLPLLDYIQGRDAGELGGELARIHWAQLDTFRAELLNAQKKPSNEKKITLLRVGIDGKIHLHRYILDSEQNTLEIV